MAIGIPLERNVRDVAFLHFWEIARRGYPIIHLPYGRTDVLRNMFGKAVLEDEAITHLVMMDTDHTHPFDIVERLLRWPMLDRDKYQVVAALAFRRSKPYYPCMFGMGPDGGLHWPVEWPRNTIMKVDSVGHPALIIDRRVLEQLPFPWWQYEYDEPGEWPTEDTYFSRLCREAGIDLWCDTTIECPHLIDNEVTEATFRAYLAEHPPKRVFVDGVRQEYGESANSVSGTSPAAQARQAPESDQRQRISESAEVMENANVSSAVEV